VQQIQGVFENKKEPIKNSVLSEIFFTVNRRSRTLFESLQKGSAICGVDWENSGRRTRPGEGPIGFSGSDNDLAIILPAPLGGPPD